MRIHQAHQYNQGIGKYKLLSSTAGVGSIITTKFGTYVLVSDINKWKFLSQVNSKVRRLLEEKTINVYSDINRDTKSLGLSLVDDKRFVNFIRKEKELDKLQCLLAIPQLALHDRFNSVNWTKTLHGRKEPIHPIALELNKLTGDFGNAQDYQIQGTHFPKWFKNGKGEFKEITKWLNDWKEEGNSISSFTPPRDASSPIKDSHGNPIKKTFTNADNVMQTITLHKELSQLNLILICPNGHLSDVPWERYLNWKTQKETLQIARDDNGENLFEFEPCCANTKLKWTESSTKSEGYGSVFIECVSCGLGSGKSNKKPKITLEGINSLKPLCRGHKPWEMEIDNSDFIPFENCGATSRSKAREKMQVTLVTANNTYYANGFSSIFIPMHLAEEKTEELWSALKRLNDKFESASQRAVSQNRVPKTRKEYWNDFDIEGFVYDDEGLNPEDFGIFSENLGLEFVNHNNEAKSFDFQEDYRFQEYKCFSNSNYFEGVKESKGLSFKDIDLNDTLSKYFTKIQQVDELKITNIQFDFTRVKPKERIALINENREKEIRESSGGQNIFSIHKEDLFVLPANETLGEGLFFQFDNVKINEWITKNYEALNDRFDRLINRDVDLTLQGASTMQKIKNNGFKHFLIHSFSHMMMRELEFTCGYPTASLKERLFISNTPEKLMSGVLIYTAEGSEGSMGGLVSQGEPAKINEILTRGLERSIHCSSDPLCWESEGQGIFDLNLAACFSCSLVAETACEEMNLGLDRRIMIDEKFGFFKSKTL